MCNNAVFCIWPDIRYYVANSKWPGISKVICTIQYTVRYCVAYDKPPDIFKVLCRV